MCATILVRRTFTMYINEIIEEIEKEATWVDYSQTRDVILTGDNKEVNKIGVIIQRHILMKH